MKVKLFVTLAVVGAALSLYSLYVPWLSFTGLIRKYYEAYEVSGSTYALGIGALNRTSAVVTVWSGEYWSTAGSDFWFGWLSGAGSLLVFISIVGFMKTKIPLMFMFLVLILIGGFLPILAFVLTMHYQPQVFVVHGQIDDYPFQTGIVKRADAIINIGVGPWLSLSSGALSIISIIWAHYFRSKQKEGKTCRERENCK